MAGQAISFTDEFLVLEFDTVASCLSVHTKPNLFRRLGFFFW